MQTCNKMISRKGVKIRKEKRPIWGRVLLAHGFHCLSSFTVQAFINCINQATKCFQSNTKYVRDSIQVTQNTRTPLNGLGSHLEKLTYIHWPHLD